MATPEYDALIVRPCCGRHRRRQACQQGWKVLLVDRDEFPSDTISTHALAFNAVDSLRHLGVIDRIEAAGFRRIFRHRAWVEDICIEAPAGPPGTYSISPRRPASWIRCPSRWIGFATHSLRISMRRQTSSLGRLSLKV